MGLRQTWCIQVNSDWRPLRTGLYLLPVNLASLLATRYLKCTCVCNFSYDHRRNVFPLISISYKQILKCMEVYEDSCTLAKLTLKVAIKFQVRIISKLQEKFHIDHIIPMNFLLNRAKIPSHMFCADSCLCLIGLIYSVNGGDLHFHSIITADKNVNLTTSKNIFQMHKWINIIRTFI